MTEKVKFSELHFNAHFVMGEELYHKTDDFTASATGHNCTKVGDDSGANCDDDQVVYLVVEPSDEIGVYNALCGCRFVRVGNRLHRYHNGEVVGWNGPERSEGDDTWMWEIIRGHVDDCLAEQEKARNARYLRCDHLAHIDNIDVAIDHASGRGLVIRMGIGENARCILLCEACTDAATAAVIRRTVRGMFSVEKGSMCKVDE